MASDNNLLGKFIFEGFEPAPRGQTLVDITFDIDTNGILHVTARDPKSGQDKDITLTNKKGCA